VLAIALCVAYLSNFINPAITSFFAFFGLAYLPLVVANIFFIFFWLWKKNKLFLISIIAIGIGYTNLGRYFQIQLPKKNITSKGIEVLSYNVRVFNYFEWEKQIPVRDSILSYIKSKGPQIVCLQEFLTRDNREQLTERYIRYKLNDLPYTHIDYTYKSNTSRSHFGVATFSKHPIIRKGKIVFDNSVNSCIYSDILFQEDTIRVYNVHLQSISLKKGYYGSVDNVLRMNSDELNDAHRRLKKAFILRAEQTKKVAQHMENSPYPVILCGDFNDTPVSHTYQKLLGDKKDSFRESGNGIGNTYRGKFPSYRIDYIFHSKSFSSSNYKTGKISLSDHYPVFCDLYLKR